MTSNGLLPLLTPPAPGLNLDASQQPRIIAASVVLIAISTVAVALRFLSRMVSKAGLWWDDWTMLAAMVRVLTTLPCRMRRLIATVFLLGCAHLHDNLLAYPTSLCIVCLTKSLYVAAHYGFGRHAAAEGNFSARVQVASKWFKLL